MAVTQRDCRFAIVRFRKIQPTQDNAEEDFPIVETLATLTAQLSVCID
jgi:hypothetical protein